MKSVQSGGRRHDCCWSVLPACRHMAHVHTRRGMGMRIMRSSVGGCEVHCIALRFPLYILSFERGSSAGWGKREWEAGLVKRLKYIRCHTTSAVGDIEHGNLPLCATSHPSMELTGRAGLTLDSVCSISMKSPMLFDYNRYRANL